MSTSTTCGERLCQAGGRCAERGVEADLPAREPARPRRTFSPRSRRGSRIRRSPVLLYANGESGSRGPGHFLSGLPRQLSIEQRTQGSRPRSARTSRLASDLDFNVPAARRSFQQHNPHSKGSPCARRTDSLFASAIIASPDYLIDHVELDVSLDIHATRVVSTLSMRPNPAGASGAALALDGDELAVRFRPTGRRAARRRQFRGEPVGVSAAPSRPGARSR